MVTKQEMYAERQRRAAAKRQQAKLTKKEKRRRKIARRKNRTDWGSKRRTWTVLVKLDGKKRLEGEWTCPGPEVAAQEFLFANRGYILENISTDRTRVEVSNEHYGTVVKAIYEIPSEDWKEIPVVLDEEDEEEKKKPGKPHRRQDDALRAAALTCLANRAMRLKVDEHNEAMAISQGRKPDPAFVADDVSGLPESPFKEEE